MAATEKRVGSSRRGMTVLGKVPVAPKPINLPSQRLENQGLPPDVDIVPRGTCSWGTAGQFPGAKGSKSRKSDAASTTLLKNCGECENGGKVEITPVSSTCSRNFGVKEGGGLLGTLIQLSSTKAATCQALDNNIKIEEPKNSTSYTCNSVDSQKQGTTETPPQKNGDGYIGGVSVPPGFGQSGPHGNQPRAGVSGPDVQCNGIGAGMYPNISQQNGLPSFPGAAHHNGKKEREIIVIHMVGSPAFYGNYPPQLGYPDIYNKAGLYGNFPLQFGNFEPYFGYQGHGRLDGGAPISSVTGSGLFDEHEDFVCYEKECYQGRKKNGFVHGNFQESTFLVGAQRDVHKALISRSSLKPRGASQKHSSRNAGRPRSLYHNGRLVPIEEASADPIPEKRITLLTKMSQPKLLTIKSLDETRVSEVAHAEYVVGPALSAHGDEGKAPETFEVNLVVKDCQVASAGLKMTDEDRLLKEPELESKEVSGSTTTCNDKCLHCKAEAAALEGPALMVCQACKKTTVGESTSAASPCCLRPIIEVPTESIDKSNSTDGCAVEVKHVIFDADSRSLSIVNGQEDASSSSSTDTAADDKQLGRMISNKTSLTQNGQEGKGKQSLLGKKGVTDGKWKPKRSVGAAKVDFEVFAPKIRKAAGKKTTPKTLANECVSETSSSATPNKKDSMGDMGADSIRLSSQTEMCNECQEFLSPSSFVTLGNVPVGGCQDSAKETANDAAFVDCVASEEHVEKKKVQNTGKASFHKDCHDNVATVCNVESLVKSVFEDISNTEVQKQFPKVADGTNERAWRPKVPTVSESKSATKVSGIRVSNAHVAPKKLQLQGRKLQSAHVSTFSAESSEGAKEEQNVVQESNSHSTSQLCNSEVLKPDKSQSFEGRSMNIARGQQCLVFRKRSTEQAALGHQSSRDTSSNKEPIGSRPTSSEGESGFEDTKESLDFISSCESDLADMNCSVSASKDHMVRRRVYDAVEGFRGDYFMPSTRMSGQLHLMGNCRSLQTTSMQNQEELRTKTVLLSPGPSYTESEHSEELSDSNSGLAANQHTRRSLLSSSGVEKTKDKKHVRPGERFPVWKPKAAPASGVLQSVIKKKDDNKSGTLISNHTEGASKETKDSESPGKLSASSHMHTGENYEEQTIENMCGQLLELESVCYQPLKKVDHTENEEDILQSTESEEVMDSQEKSEIVVSMEEAELTTVLKHVEEVLKLESLGPEISSKEVVVHQTSSSCSEENTVGNCRPFFKKKNVMSYEMADRYHQIMFKKYKETGHWKPKAGIHRKVPVESDGASGNGSEAPMQDVLVVAC